MSTALVALAGVVAAVVVRTTAHTPRARGLWWLAGPLAAGVAAATQAASPVPTAVGLAAGGIVGVAVIDAAEGRIPTAVAWATTAVSWVALVSYAVARDQWGRLVVGPALFGALLVGACLLLWLAKAMGFGDVRLAAATVTALVSGAEGMMLVLWCAFVVSGLTALALRLAGRRLRRLPFGPGLAAGWLVAVLLG